MGKKIIKRPLILIAIFCVLGILFAYWGLTNPLFFIALFISLSIYGYKKDNYDRFFIIAAAAILIFAFFITSNKLSYTPEIHSFSDKEITISGQVISPAVNKDGKIQVYIKNSTYSVNGKSYNANDKILVNIYEAKYKKKKTNLSFKVGDYYSFKGKVKIPSGKRNYGGFDYKLYLKTTNINTYINVYNENVKFIADSNLPLHIDKLYNIKEFFKEKINSGLNDKNKSDLIMGILFSDKDLDGNIREDFSVIGLSHIMAVSGLHIGMIYIMLEFLLGAMNINKKKRVFIIAPILIFYILLAGMSASAVRAGILCLINMLVSLDENHDGDLLNYLVLTMLIMLLANPLSLFNLSFQLSFLAVGGIVLFSGVMTSKLPEIFMRNPVLKFISEVIIISISTTLLTLPVLVNSFSGISLISIIANMLITPLVSIIMTLSVIAVILSFTPVGTVLFMLLSIILGYILSTATFLSSLPYNFISLQYMHLHDIIFYLVIILVVSPYINLKSKKQAITSFIIIAVCTGINIYNILPKDYAEVHFLDVGQGNCSIVITPDRKCIMFDGGGSVYSDYNTGENTIQPFLSYHGISDIEAVFISHTDADHVKGIYQLKDILPIKNIVVGYLDEDEEREIRKNTNSNIIKTAKDEIYSTGDIKVRTLNEVKQTNSKDNNDKSAVFMVEYKGEKILYPGDMTNNTASEMLKDSSDINATIMDSAHHGSYYESMDLFINKANPEYCIIQAGSNNYGLPNKPFLQLLDKKGIKYYITQTSGGIRFKIREKKNTQITTFLEE